VSPVYPTVQTRQAQSNASIVAVAAVHAPGFCHQAQPHLRNCPLAVAGLDRVFWMLIL